VPKLRLFAFARDHRGILSSQQVLRAIWLGALIGTVAGFGAIGFFLAIEHSTDFFLGRLAGYRPPQPLGEGGGAGVGPARAWALPLVLGLGGLLSGVIVFSLAPEAEGHGTDAAIAAFHRRAGRVNLRVIPVKLVASAITIGSGGAAGREGPTAQVGAGFGSLIADLLRLGPAERRRALAAGMGAGIGAIFRAPLGGAMMAAEALYRHDLEADVILLGLIASITAYAIFGAWSDYEPMFGLAQGFTFRHPQELIWYAILGVLCGAIGILYVKTFYGTRALFRRLRMPAMLKPALGGLAAGAIGFAAPEAIHVGYGFVQQALTREGALSFDLWLLLLLPFARILTTSLTVGSGGSGGVFGPGMVIGGLTGAGAWRLLHGVPGFPAEPGPVVIVAMIATFGAVAHAPLAMLLMVGEMTGNLSLLAPAMLAVAVATLLVGDVTIYEAQVPTRADSPAHRGRYAFPLLSTLPAGRAAYPVPLLEASVPAAAALEALRASHASFGIVVENGRIVGELTAEDARTAAGSPRTAGSLARPIPAVVTAETPLDEALDLLANHERRWLPVVQRPGGPVVGAIDTRTLLRAYRRAVRMQARPVAPIGEGLEAIQLVLPPDSPLAGKKLAEANLPPGVRVLVFTRQGETAVPSGDTRLEAGDVVTVALPPGRRDAVLKAVLGTIGAAGL
jgi:CIC family chloride channel protein